MSPYQSQSAVEAALTNCFMSNATVPGTDYTYSWLFCWVGEKYNINPVALASRVRQEQGSGNSAMISGTYAGYEGLYNYFNIQATGSTRDEILQKRFKKEAQTGFHYDASDGFCIYRCLGYTIKKALIGGSLKFANQYILRNQNTLYAQKFDYDGQFNGKYWHQYMTNIMAPYSEGNQVRRSYSTTGQMGNNFVFLIPVYEERPESSLRPAEHKNQNTCLNSITVNDQEVIKTFDKDQMDFYYNVGKNTIYANVQVKAAADTSNVAFNNIGDLSHKVEATTITVSAEDGSTREYRLIIGCGVEIEDGFFDDFDVTAYRKRYPKLSRKYGDDLDAYYEHYLLKGKAAGWDGSTNGVFPSERPSAIYNGVDYAPVFDAEYYLNKYPDLKAAFGNDSSAALNHFITFGIKEGRQGCDDFSIDIYKGNYPDLRKAFGNNNDAYVAHYLEYGLKEGRDGLEVLQDSKDNTSDDKKDDTNTGYVASARKRSTPMYMTISTIEMHMQIYEQPLAMTPLSISSIFCRMEWQKDVRHVGDFDVKIYKNNYKDLQAAFGNNTALYYTHYMEHGKAEHRNAAFEVTGNNTSTGGSNAASDSYSQWHRLLASVRL